MSLTIVALAEQLVASVARLKHRISAVRAEHTPAPHGAAVADPNAHGGGVGPEGFLAGRQLRRLHVSSQLRDAEPKRVLGVPEQSGRRPGVHLNKRSGVLQQRVEGLLLGPGASVS